MLKVKVEIIPRGDKSKCRVIKTIDITNVGNDKHPEYGTYVARCEREIRFVRNYKRGRGALALLQLVFEQYQRKVKIGGDLTDLDKHGHLKSYGFIDLQDLDDFYKLTAQKQYKHWVENGKKIKPFIKRRNRICI